MKKYIIYLKNNNFAFYTLLFASVLLSLSLLYSCGANIFTESDDIQLGKELDKEIKSNYPENLFKNNVKPVSEPSNETGKDNKSNYAG